MTIFILKIQKNVRTKKRRTDCTYRETITCSSSYVHFKSEYTVMYNTQKNEEL